MTNNLSYWKLQASKLLVFMRALFLMAISADFFLTLVSPASQKALVLTGFGAPFYPLAIAIWVILIVGLLISFTGSLRKGALDNSIFNMLAQTMLYLSAVFYIGLTFLTLVNPAVAWPILIVYVANVIWSVGLLHFRKVFLAHFD